MARVASEVPAEVLESVAKRERVPIGKLKKLVRRGWVTIPWNPRHAPRAVGIGAGLRVKINANLGTSPGYVNLDEELEKARVAAKYGSDAVMDLSIGGDINAIRRAILKATRLPLGTVPIYQVGMEYAKRSAVVDMCEDDIFRAVEAHAKDGVDFMTLHCGVTRESIEKLRKHQRILGIVSRGGAFLAAWMLHNEQENPLYANYEYLLELAKSYQFAISLGDGLRPGTVADASDASQFQELIVLGELVRKARKKGVQVIVEGPGHLPMNQIAANVKLEKTICDNAPFYVLGPLVTDIAPGYDHIVGAIGAALAAYHGADFICYVTPGEHLALPTVEDVREGVVAARVAVHAAEVAKGDLCADAEISRARSRMDWAAQFQCAVDPEKAKKYRERRRPLYGDACSMCGEFCAIKIANSYRYAFSRSENAVQRAAFFAKRKTQTGKKSRSENAVQRAAFALRANANRKK